MIGRRREGVKPYDLEVGDYTVDDHAVWARLPTAELVRIDTSAEGAWTREVHDDGAVTINPSILMHPVEGHSEGWHGWLRAGVWTEA